MPSLGAEPLVLPDVEILVVAYETLAETSDDTLPSGLHPTIPPLVTFVIWRCPDGPLGAFSMAQVRVACRSGARPRAFVAGAVADTTAAAEALRDRWGFPCRTGKVSLERSYDRVTAEADIDGLTVLSVGASDPVPLRPSDVQWIANMHAAHTPKGFRLVQVDADHDVTRAERGRPALRAFDPAAWGDEAIVPTAAVAASFCTATITLPKIRYLCAPDRLAFFGTEVVG